MFSLDDISGQQYEGHAFGNRRVEGPSRRRIRCVQQAIAKWSGTSEGRGARHPDGNRWCAGSGKVVGHCVFGQKAICNQNAIRILSDPPKRQNSGIGDRTGKPANAPSFSATLTLGRVFACLLSAGLRCSPLYRHHWPYSLPHGLGRRMDRPAIRIEIESRASGFDGRREP